VSRAAKRQLSRSNGGRGSKTSPARAPRAQTPQRRLNRLLIIGGSALAVGAVVLAFLSRHFDPMALTINLAAIGLGLLMGKGIGRFIFRRGLSANK
jgi:hypothetical protein